MLSSIQWALIPLVIVGFIVVIFIFQWLWNTTMPQVFGVKQISFFQALKILLISLLLTGGGSSLFSVTHTETKTKEETTATKTIKFGLP